MHVYVYVSEVQQSCLKSSSLDKTGTSVGAKSKKETSLPFSMGPVNSHRTSPESIFLWQADMTLDSRGSCIDSHHKHNLLSSFQEPPDTWNYYVSLSKIPFLDPSMLQLFIFVNDQNSEQWTEQNIQIFFGEKKNN